MNEEDYKSLVGSLHQAVEILDRNRTPDPGLIAALDTLKQARAMVLRAVHEGHLEPLASERVLVAA